MTNLLEPRTIHEQVYYALKSGDATRPELAARTGLRISTVINAVDALMYTGLVRLENATHSTRGRPPARVRLIPDRFTVTVVDLSGEMIRSGRYDLAGRRLKYLEHDPLQVQRFPNALLTADDLLNWLREQGPADLSVVSALGVVHPRTRMITSQVFGFRDYPLEAELSAALGWPVIVEGNANLAAWNTWRHLRLTASDPLLYIIYSCGFAAGMMLAGTLYHGATGAAGEMSLVTTTDKPSRYDQPLMRMINYLFAAIPGGTLSEVTALAKRGDETAQRALNRYTTDLANYLTFIATVVEPAVLVLQDVPHVAEPLSEEVTFALKDAGLRVQVMISPLGPMSELDSAAQYGISALERARLLLVREL